MDGGLLLSQRIDLPRDCSLFVTHFLKLGFLSYYISHCWIYRQVDWQCIFLYPHPGQHNFAFIFSPPPLLPPNNEQKSIWVLFLVPLGVPHHFGRNNEFFPLGKTSVIRSVRERIHGRRVKEKTWFSCLIWKDCGFWRWQWCGARSNRNWMEKPERGHPTHFSPPPPNLSFPTESLREHIGAADGKSNRGVRERK